MTTPGPDTDSPSTSAPVEMARLRVAAAETRWKATKVAARAAKQRRQEAKIAARRARKQAKKAKSLLTAARAALEKAQATLAASGDRPKPRRSSKRKARRPAGLIGSRKLKPSASEEAHAAPASPAEPQFPREQEARQPDLSAVASALAM